MRSLDTSQIRDAIKAMLIKANYDIGADTLHLLESRMAEENSNTATSVMSQIIENDRIALRESIPMCQDTGMAVIFLEIGQDVFLTGQNLNDAVNEGVQEAYCQGYLRKSVVADPLFDRINTKDNTPAVLYTDIVSGSSVKIIVAPKGFGSENMSAVKMLKPSDGADGVIQFILEVVEKAGPNPCPPIVVGIGIGGTFEKCTILAKKALTRDLGSHNCDKRYSVLEDTLLDKINKLGIGPAGLGGKTTALAVHIEHYPTHIAGMPVAVNICCHAYRHGCMIL